MTGMYPFAMLRARMTPEARSEAVCLREQIDLDEARRDQKLSQAAASHHEPSRISDNADISRSICASLPTVIRR